MTDVEKFLKEYTDKLERDDFVKAYKLQKKQGVPKGADPATHERCVRKLKQKGHDKSSAFAICNAAGAGKK